VSNLVDRITSVANDSPAALLVGTLCLLFAGWLIVFLVGRRRGPKPAGAESEPQALKIEQGARVTRIPAYRARLQWHIGRTELDAIGLLDDLMTMGLSLSASDIHFNPSPSHTTVSFRVHGVLYELGIVPAHLYPRVVSRVKVLGSLTLYKRSTPQDGEISLHGGKHKARVSLLPTNHGEKIVMRLASAEFQNAGIDSLGMDPVILARFKSMLESNQGMIIVTGPTGSGKTTTMYAGLQHINQQRGRSTNIVTLEDPIEFDFPQFSQTQIEPEAGMTFAVGLRSVLRQDPDVILVGEIRDDETSEIAVRAAMTGHLIFTTIHADRAAGVFNRIIQMNVERYQVASAVRMVISQRLCQALCPSCRVESALTAEQEQRFEFLGYKEVPEGPFFTATGCESCLHKGFEGRAAVYEVLPVTDAVRDLINEGEPTHRLEKLAIHEGMRTLFEHGIERAREGDIPVDEVLRVLAI
jgi:general secretion pathway protein E